MTGRTRYGDLLHDAGAQITVADRLLAAERLRDPLAGLHAAVAYRDLLHAAHRHGWHLFGGEDRIAGIRAATRVDPGDRAAVRFLDATAAIARRSVVGGASSARGPAAVLLAELPVRAAGLGALAHATTVVARRRGPARRAGARDRRVLAADP